MLYNAENSYDLSVDCASCTTGGKADHDTKDETQGSRQERVAVLYPKVLLARELADYDVHADYGGAEDTSW